MSAPAPATPGRKSEDLLLQIERLKLENEALLEQNKQLRRALYAQDEKERAAGHAEHSYYADEVTFLRRRLNNLRLLLDQVDATVSGSMMSPRRAPPPAPGSAAAGGPVDGKSAFPGVKLRRDTVLSTSGNRLALAPLQTTAASDKKEKDDNKKDDKKKDDKEDKDKKKGSRFGKRK